MSENKMALRLLGMEDCTDGMTAEFAERTETLAQGILQFVGDFVDDPTEEDGRNDSDEIRERTFMAFILDAGYLGIAGEDENGEYCETFHDMIDAAVDYWNDELFPGGEDW